MHISMRNACLVSGSTSQNTLSLVTRDGRRDSAGPEQKVMKETTVIRVAGITDYGTMYPPRCPFCYRLLPLSFLRAALHRPPPLAGRRTGRKAGRRANH